LTCLGQCHLFPCDVGRGWRDRCKERNKECVRGEDKAIQERVRDKEIERGGRERKRVRGRGGEGKGLDRRK
jgi:hypothetical protein